MNINETALPQNLSRVLLEDKHLDVAAEHTAMIYDVLFTAVANLLNSAKSKEKPTAFVITRVDGSVVIAAILQYFPGETKKDPGNWSLVWTFDQSDIPEGSLVINIADPNTHSYFASVFLEKYSIMEEDDTLIDLFKTAAEQLHKWLDENAKAGEEVTIEEAGVFQARVAIENDEKVFSIEPDGEIKVLIKDDAAIEK